VIYEIKTENNHNKLSANYTVLVLMSFHQRRVNSQNFQQCIEFITTTEVEAIARVSFNTNTTVTSFRIRAFRVFGARKFLFALVDVYNETMK